MPDYFAILEQYNFNLLKDIANLLQITPDGNTKGAHAKALARVLGTPKIVEKGLSLLSQREKQALILIQRGGGKISAARLLHLLVREQIATDSVGAKSQLQRATSVFAPESMRTSPGNIMARLMASGLVYGQDMQSDHYSMRSKIYYDNVQTLYIPEEIALLLPPPPPEVVEEPSPDILTRIEEGSSRAFQRELYLYWSTARHMPLNLTQQGRLYKNDLKRVNAQLLKPEDLTGKDETDISRMIFMRNMMLHLGILSDKQPGQIQAVEHTEFLGQTPHLRVKQAMTSWRDGDYFNELLDLSNVHINGVNATRLDRASARIVQARQAVFKHIVQLYQEGWVWLSRLTEHVRQRDYDFLLPRNYQAPRLPYYYYYNQESKTPYQAYGNEMGWTIGSFQDEADGWDVVEAGFIRTVLEKPMFWMGLVDLGYVGDRLMAYRLTPIGAWALGVGKEIEIPEGEGRVIVQPNYEILAMDPISDLVLARLDEFADRISAERAIQYTLTRESVYRAQKAGWMAGRIIETLQKLSDKPLPQNVARTLQEWQQLYERITIRRHVGLLQAANKELLDGLTGASTVAQLLLSRPGDTVALFTSSSPNVSALVDALYQMGQMPAQTQGPDHALHPSLTIAADGQIVLAEALPSIYLFQQIAPWTERDGQGRYWLTPKAVQSALQAGLSVSEILERLRTLHVGPLPRWVEIKVRAWGHYYGDAAIQPITLVQFRDTQTLQELLQEPELQGLLQPFKPDAGHALAVVSADQVSQLHQFLNERGIGIADRLT